MYSQRAIYMSGLASYFNLDPLQSKNLTDADIQLNRPCPARGHKPRQTRAVFGREMGY